MAKRGSRLVTQDSVDLLETVHVGLRILARWHPADLNLLVALQQVQIASTTLRVAPPEVDNVDEKPLDFGGRE